MSWYIQYEFSGRDLTDESEAKIMEYIVQNQDVWNEETKKQFGVAMITAVSLVETGSLGDPDGDFFVTISGHANPENKDVPGWSTDCITVNVTRKPAS